MVVIIFVKIFHSCSEFIFCLPLTKLIIIVFRKMSISNRNTLNYNIASSIPTLHYHFNSTSSNNCYSKRTTFTPNTLYTWLALLTCLIAFQIRLCALFVEALSFAIGLEPSRNFDRSIKWNVARHPSVWLPNRQRFFQHVITTFILNV